MKQLICGHAAMHIIGAAQIGTAITCDVNGHPHPVACYLSGIHHIVDHFRTDK
jgi:hypothetical protein